MSVSRDEAAEALRSMQGARVRANEMKKLPFIYHIAFGALTGGWIIIQGLSDWAFGVGVLLFVAATWGMYRWQLQATSRWVNGFRFGRTLWVAAVMAAVLVGLLMTSNPRMATFETFTPLQGGLIAFFAVTFLDWLWMKVYDSEVRGRP